MSTANVSNQPPNFREKFGSIEVLGLGGLLVVDQISKLWAQQRDLVIMNEGGVFGVLPSELWVIGLTAVWLLMVWQWWTMHFDLSRVGMGLIVMGGLGNLIDRFLFGSVRDFIYYPMLGFYGNIADIYLAIGVVMVIWGQLKSDKIPA